MGVSVPNGATVSIANGYSASVNVTAISNAKPAVATAAGHTFTEGQFVEITSGWAALSNKIVRVGAVTANTFELEDYDTTLLTKYPAGNGGGSARSISGWTPISQIINTTSSGGDQQFLNYQFLESSSESRIPTIKNAAGLALNIADDTTQAGYALCDTADSDRLPRAIKIDLPSGAHILYDTYVSLNKTPTLTINQLMALQVTLSFLNEPVRYAS